ncbi:MAG TPA: YARHG domain-containing protein [Methylocella sp.]|nr:YARHG domain-containing protein [Methylocella sp.]
MPQNLYAMSCSELWHQRNSIFKAAGYCFHTPRAIRAFGNAGCAYDSESDVPLSDRDRQYIRAIRAAERTKGCLR